ncbi:MAG: dihydroneopterin aldolase [Gemmatimonadaceae bacterium]
MSEPASLESISLRGMRFHALVGILPHEQEHPQPLEVDVTVWRAMPAPRGAPAGVLDYRELYDLVATHVAMQPVHYLEELAHALADAAMARWPLVRAQVALRKPHVALPGPLAHAEVAVDRVRER